jgi:hypothetical protein
MSRISGTRWLGPEATEYAVETAFVRHLFTAFAKDGDRLRIKANRNAVPGSSRDDIAPRSCREVGCDFSSRHVGFVKEAHILAFEDGSPGRGDPALLHLDAHGH